MALHFSGAAHLEGVAFSERLAYLHARAPVLRLTECSACVSHSIYLYARARLATDAV